MCKATEIIVAAAVVAAVLVVSQHFAHTEWAMHCTLACQHLPHTEWAMLTVAVLQHRYCTLACTCADCKSLPHGGTGLR